ncbi:AsmA family protein [Microbaculum marinum]|uniref:AsmA family protein n=1 Tax=Microbaculum marinum TaxID=1764581 RepID=A0AAW9RR83_9HYPH
MKRALFTLMGLVVIAIVVVLLAPLLISAQDVRNTLFAQVENATGYRLRVTGPLDISVFPALSLVAGDVGVSQQTDGAWEEFATAQEVRFGLSLPSLLSGNVRMSEVALVAPVIRVPQANAAAIAVPSERQEPAEAVPSVRQDDAATAPASGTASPAAALRNLSIDELTIIDGILVLPESDSSISGVNLTAALAAYDAPLSLDLSAVVDGRPVSAKGTVEAFGPFLEGAAQPVTLTLTADGVLAQELTVSGTALYTGERFAFDPFTATAGDSAFGGSVSGDLSGEVPVITASLNGERIDLDALLAPAGGRKGRGTGGDKADGTAADGTAADASAGVQAPTSAGDPIDVSALSSVRARVDVSLSNLIASGIAVSPLVANLSVGDGKADVVADLIGIGGASGAGSVSLDATQDSPYLSGKLRISDVDLARAAALAGKDLPVTGIATADVAFATAGKTVEEMQARLNATGSASLADGSVVVPELAAALGGDAGPDGTISGINVTAAFEDLVKPVSIDGSAVWRGERFDLDATGDVRGILAGQTSAINVTAASPRVSAGFTGNVNAAGRGDGRISLETASLTGLMRWLGQQPAWQSGFETFAINGRLAVSETAVSFEDTNVILDESRGTGAGRITLGAKPTVEARLNLEILDINPYLGAAANSGQAAGQASPAPAPGGAPQAGWDTAPIDFSALNALNADLALDVGRLVYKDIEAGPVAITATIDGGRLNAELANLALYEGAGAGSLTVDAGGKTPSQAFKFTLQDLNAYPFLSDAAGFTRIEGTGAIAVDLTASGASQAAIVSALNGTASFRFTDGAIRGINVAKMVRNLASGTLSGWQQGEAEKTDFAALGASFRVTNGQAVTDDLHLVGPLVRVAGSGSVDMPAQAINFKVDPKVVASLEGQGSEKDLEGLGVPVIVSGPWSSPRIYPDIAGILQDPQAAYDQLRKIGGGLFNLPGGGTGGSGGGDLVSGIDQQLKEKTGLSIDDILKDGKVDQDALQQGVVTGLQQLLQSQQGGQPQGGQPGSGQPQGGQPQGGLQGTLQQFLQSGQIPGGQPQGGQPQGGQPQAALSPDQLQGAPQGGQATSDVTGAIPLPRPDPRTQPKAAKGDGQTAAPKQNARQQPEGGQTGDGQRGDGPKTGTGADAADGTEGGGQGGRKSRKADGGAPQGEQSGGQQAGDQQAAPEELDAEDVAKQLLQGLFGNQ